jgi:RimJ/RimL family protein N-acetyltransferase
MPSMLNMPNMPNMPNTPNMPIIVAPVEIRTPRLTLARWRRSHAPSLGRALESSVDDLRGWIPWRIAEPAPVDVLEQRIAGFVADFDTGREWVYAIHEAGADEVLGAFGLYPRDATKRAPIADADRVELGYWLRTDVTGRGYATEAGAALIETMRALGAPTLLEIRCDPRNARSAAIPVRLGFELAETIDDPRAPADDPCKLMIWRRDLVSS